MGRPQARAESGQNLTDQTRAADDATDATDAARLESQPKHIPARAERRIGCQRYRVQTDRKQPTADRAGGAAARLRNTTIGTSMPARMMRNASEPDQPRPQASRKRWPARRFRPDGPKPDRRASSPLRLHRRASTPPGDRPFGGAAAFRLAHRRRGQVQRAVAGIRRDRRQARRRRDRPTLQGCRGHLRPRCLRRDRRPARTARHLVRPLGAVACRRHRSEDTCRSGGASRLQPQPCLRGFPRFRRRPYRRCRGRSGSSRDGACPQWRDAQWRPNLRPTRPWRKRPGRPTRSRVRCRR